jgi:cytochrome c-type biogenesis protein CcmH/NrfG
MRKKRIVLGAAILLTAATALFALPYHPVYQERQCQGRSLEELQVLLQRLPENPIVLYYLGRALHQASRSAEAIPLLQRAVALDADTPRLREALVEAQMARGETRGAFDGLRLFLETHPDTPDAYRMLARFYLSVQTLSRAVIVLEEGVKRFPDEDALWALLAHACEKVHDMRRATEAVTRAIALKPDEAEYWLLQAQIQANAAEARVSYQKALQLAPDDLNLQAEYADFVARKGIREDQDRAERMARQVLAKSGEHPKASAALGLILAERNEFAEALPLLQHALRVNAQDIPILTALQRLNWRAGHTAEAKRWEAALRRAHAYRLEYKRLLDAVEDNPKDTAFQQQLGRLLGRHGQITPSLRYHGLALGLPPDAPLTLQTAARDLQEGGFSAQARQLAERSLQNSTTDSERMAARELLDSLP